MGRAAVLLLAVACVASRRAFWAASFAPPASPGRPAAMRRPWPTATATTKTTPPPRSRGTDDDVADGGAAAAVAAVADAPPPPPPPPPEGRSRGGVGARDERRRRRERQQLNPSAEFGSPLSDRTSALSSAAVGFVKNSVFDAVFDPSDPSRAYARFYALETIARVPYFAYLSVLHLYETLGRWRRADYLRVHFAESWNELHHLLIMEELGGADRWADRFVAQHAAFGYYWFVVGVYLINPTLAYNLNQAVEEHAYETYDRFVADHGDMLASAPAPEVARRYYRDGDLYMFEAMHAAGDMMCGEESCDDLLGTGDAGGAGMGRAAAAASAAVAPPSPRRPKCDTLLDVFLAIRDDEAEHVRTMAFLQRKDADLGSAGTSSSVAPASGGGGGTEPISP